MILTDQQIAPIDVEKRRQSDFGVGDTVRIHQKIVEKDKTRIQVFEGTVIARKHGTEPGATFTVRRVDADGISVEKIFPLYTPTIDRIEVSQKIKTRRAKLYFLRERTPRQIREKLRNTVASIKDAVVSDPEQQEKMEGVATSEAQQKEKKEEVEKQPVTQQEEPPKQEKVEVEKQPVAQQGDQQKQQKKMPNAQPNTPAQSDADATVESKQTEIPQHLDTADDA